VSLRAPVPSVPTPPQATSPATAAVKPTSNRLVKLSFTL
jgi:hypothetical protein